MDRKVKCFPGETVEKQVFGIISEIIKSLQGHYIITWYHELQIKDDVVGPREDRSAGVEAPALHPVCACMKPRIMLSRFWYFGLGSDL